jgi:hypothetical protein
MVTALIGTATKSHKLLGGEQWSDIDETIHAAASEFRTVCGTRIGAEAKGWFLETRHVPSHKGHVSCARCAAKLPPAPESEDWDGCL